MKTTSAKTTDSFSVRLLKTASVALLALALPAYAQFNTTATLLESGSAPTPGPDDQSQFNTPSGANNPDTLNYYFDNGTPPGQTFTTGTNTYGYMLNTVSILLADNAGSLNSQTFLLRIYSVLGNSATLLASFTSQTFTISGTSDWLTFTNLGLNLSPNTQYAYTLHRNGSGWCNLANVTNNPYAAGEVCLVPGGGGTITFGSSHHFDATFDVGLTASTTSLVIGIQPVSLGVISGQSASVRVSVSGASPHYQWFTCSDASYSNPAGISSATTNTYSIASTTTANATNYFVVATNSSGSSVTSSVVTLAVAQSATATLSESATAPTLGAADIYQTNVPSGANSPDGLNYYFDNAIPPGQTFTTGPNFYGYTLSTMSIKLADSSGGLPGGGQTYSLRIYSMSGANATWLAVYTSQNYIITGNTDWLTFTNLGLTLSPNTQYAYTLGRNSAGWCNLANVTNNPYAGGEVCLIPTTGGAVTFGTNHSSDATFDVGLITNGTAITVIQQPSSQTVALGQPASFTAGVIGYAPRYQWFTCSDTSYSNPAGITNATFSTYSIASAGVADATNYFAVITNTVGGAATSAVATLTVKVTGNSLAWLGGASFSWDYSTANWSNTVSGSAPVAFQPVDNAFFGDAGKSSSSISLATSLYPGSVAVNTSSNYTFAGSGSLNGIMGLTKAGTGTLTINNANSFTGGATISNGVLRLGNVTALGATNCVVSVNGGTLDINSTLAPANWSYQVQGTGYTNAGVIENFGSGNSQNNNGIVSLTLTGDATIGAIGARWDLAGTGVAGSTGLQGNGYALTKVGPADIWLIDGGTSTGLGAINVLRGTLGFQAATAMGDPNQTMTVYPGAIFGMWANSLTLVKSLVLTNGGIYSGGGVNNFAGPITLWGTDTLNCATDLHLGGNGTGSGGISKSGTANLYLEGTNTYTGQTLLSSGQIILGANGALNGSSLIQVAGSATLDASASVYGLTLGSGQTLAGGSGATGATVLGNVTNGPASVISAGINGPGLLTVGQLALSGATNLVYLGSDPNDTSGAGNSFLQDSGDLTLSGMNTLQVVLVGTPNTSTPYSVMSYSGTLSGGSNNLRTVSTNPRFTFSVVNPATTAPYIEISVTGSSQPLLWKGGVPSNPTIWNHSTTNWMNTISGLYDRFYDGDTVVFDDTAVTNVINVADTNTPATMTFNNTNLNYTLFGAGTLAAGTLDQEGTGTVTLAISNTITLSVITNNQGTLVLNQPLNTTLSAVVNDNSGGLGTIMKAGTNTLMLTGNNANYYGTFAVTNGVLQFNNYVALGSTTPNSIYATNGGSLDLNNVSAGLKIIVIAGAGYNGLGALMDSQAGWPAYPYEIVNNVTLAGDATIGGNNRWDIPSSGTLNGNGFALTKVGTGQNWLKFANGDGNLGNINVVAGQLGFQGAAMMGDPTKTATVGPGANLGIWANNNMLDKVLVLSGGTLYSGGSSNNFVGPVTLVSSTNTIQTDSDLHLWGPIGGTGGFVKASGSTLWLDGTNTYSGPTIVSANSAVVVGTNSSLGSSSTIEIDGGSTLDVSQPSSFNLGSGQTMIGNGAVLGGNVNFGSGSTLAVGFSGSTYTLTMGGNLAFQAGSTNSVKVNKTTSIANDKVSGLSSVTMGGTLVIANIGNALAGGDAIPLFSATTYAGGFSSIVPATPGPGLAWNTNTLDSDGTLRVLATVDLTPTNIVAHLSGNQLTLSWPTNHIGWRLQAQTNALNTGLGTNWVDLQDSSTTNQVIITINPANGTVFYRMAY